MDKALEAGHGAEIPRLFRDYFAATESFAGEGVGRACEIKMRFQ